MLLLFGICGFQLLIRNIKKGIIATAVIPGTVHIIPHASHAYLVPGMGIACYRDAGNAGTAAKQRKQLRISGTDRCPAE